MKIVYPGTFDPITLGHVDIIGRAARLFEEVIVAVGNNPAKTTLFSQAERAEMVEQELTAINNTSVETFDGLLVDYLKKRGFDLVLRGLRSMTDLEYEQRMFATNRAAMPSLEVVFMAASPEFTFYNSRLLREIASGGYAPRQIVSPLVAARLKAKTGK